MLREIAAATKIQSVYRGSKVLAEVEAKAKAAKEAAADAILANQEKKLPPQVEILINDFNGLASSRAVCNGFRNLVSSIKIKPNVSKEKIIKLIEKNQNHLKSLDLSNTNVDNDFLNTLANSKSLHTLDLTGCYRVTDVSALGKCESLHTLDLTGCYRVTNVSALAGCASLHTLNLSYCRGVTDVSALAGCASLHTLDLRHSGVTGVSEELSHLTINR